MNPRIGDFPVHYKQKMIDGGSKSSLICKSHYRGFLLFYCRIMKTSQIIGIIALSGIASSASAQLISPLNGIDYSTYGISAEGGVVIDIVGTSGVQVVSQIAAIDLFSGYYIDPSLDPFGFLVPPTPAVWVPGSVMAQGFGFSPSIVSSLGGGISAMSIRLTEYDGDTGSSGLGPGMNQFNPNLDPLAAGIDLIVNGQNVANFEDVGFESDTLDTGFFTISDSTALASIYSVLSVTNVVELNYDEGLDKGLALVDFQTGLDKLSLMNSVDPTIVDVIPEPSAVGILGFASILGFIAVRRRR
jgi:hypothetical protein